MVNLLATVELELLSESEVLGGLVDHRLEGGYLLLKLEGFVITAVRLFRFSAVSFSL